MASKQRWLSTLAAQDVYATMEAFEEMNQILVEITLTLRDGDGRRGPWILASAFTRPAAGAVPALLASVQCRCTTMDYASLDTAAFRVLYMLDASLDSLERERDPKKSAALPAK